MFTNSGEIMTVKIYICAAFQDFGSYVLILIDAKSLTRYEFDINTSGCPLSKNSSTQQQC